MVRLICPIDENHSKQPQSPYSATKIGADAMAMSFYNAFGLPVVISVHSRHTVLGHHPNHYQTNANGKSEIKLGDLPPVRDSNFVKDTCRGFIELSKCDAAIGGRK